ncbi:MAG: molybdopterin-dependent oxidoreductase [Candidatus Thorarchaeota archaeon]|jgi:DMSO/TMAO reductase YedYZ molybdopterin-dependent catalytic subunit
MMKKMERDLKFLAVFIIAMFVVSVSLIIADPLSPPEQIDDSSEFPDFITKNEDYFITRIGTVPEIDRDTYRLEISGLVDNRTSFSLDQLQSLNLTEMPLTIECIGNREDGPLIGTAVWKGFNLYDLLQTLGVSENATGVRYITADNYYASHTMDQLRDNGVMGALYMNGVEIPPVQGFPLRILNPGYYGAKQPAWVIGIEAIDRPLEDYWDDFGWDTSPPMNIDSHMFFPEEFATIGRNENLKIGGCAFGGTRVKLVEYTIDYGLTWSNASIVQQIDADNVWVFWEINLSFSSESQIILQVRATDINDNLQTRTDSNYRDGTSSWPHLTITVI